MTIRRVLLGLVLAGAAGACYLVIACLNGACYLPGDDTGMSNGIGIENRSSETVNIFYLDPAGVEHIVVADLQALSGTALLSPGRWIGDCNEGTLKAYTASGRVIAETSERLCDGDRWVIPADASASPK